MSRQMRYDVIIIGAGAAGLTSALLLKRSGINCCIIESNNPGGYMLKMPVISNYPGVFETTGVELAKNMLSQVNEIGVDYVNAKVSSIKVEGNIKSIITDKGTMTSEFVIIATGRVPNTLNFMEDTYENLGISYSDIDDGVNYKDKNIVVIGEDSDAVKAVLYLSTIANHITLICREDYLKAKEKYQDHLKYLDNLEVLYNTNVIGFDITNQMVSSVSTSNGSIKCEGCFIYNGYIVNSSPFKDLGILNKDDYIETDKVMQTQVRGVYAVGDVRYKKVYEITTAVSDATIAAVSIIRELSL